MACQECLFGLFTVAQVRLRYLFLVVIFSESLASASERMNIFSFEVKTTGEVQEKIPLTVVVQTDDYPEETSWSLNSRDGTVAFANVLAGEYPAIDGGEIETTTVYVEPDEELSFVITDSGGDGICCGENGDGYYEIYYGADTKNEQLRLVLGGNSGPFDKETKHFEATNPRGDPPVEYVPISVKIQVDESPEETGWRLEAADGTSVYSDNPSETYDGQVNETIVTTLYTMANEALRFIITDDDGDGIENGYYRVYYGMDVTDDSALLVSGGTSGAFDEEVHHFSATSPDSITVPSSDTSSAPSQGRSMKPSHQESSPSQVPTGMPSRDPSKNTSTSAPSQGPSMKRSHQESQDPTGMPSRDPSKIPSQSYSRDTTSPSSLPSQAPTGAPFSANPPQHLSRVPAPSSESLEVFVEAGMNSSSTSSASRYTVGNMLFLSLAMWMLHNFG